MNRTGNLMFNDNDPWSTNRNGGNRPTNSGSGREDDFDKIIAKIREFLRMFFGGDQKNKGLFPFNKKQFFVGLLIVLLAYMSMGFYMIQPDEEGVELFFGKYYDTVTPGLRYHPPSPIGKIIKVKVKTVNREEIGSRFYTDGVSDHGEGVMLTGDENIVNINFDVQWRVSNAYDYLFKVRDYKQGATVKNAAESAMREVIGKSTISFAIEGKGRAVISQETKVLLQKILDHYSMGIEVLSVQLKKVDPPEKVISAFRDVQSARADQQRVINEARSYSNDILPRAKGEAVKIRLDAEGYESEVVNIAEGNSKRFISLYNEYKNQPKPLRNRIYLETMEEILSKTDKVVVSDDLKGMFSYLPLANNSSGK